MSDGSGSSKTTKPVALPVTFKDIPADLTGHSRWVVWRYVWENERWAKPPFNAQTGKRASPAKPSTWSTFRQARTAYEGGGWGGIGFVLGCAASPFDLVGIDLDDVIDPATGVLHPEAASMVKEISSYTERSPSGHGLRILARGGLPPGKRAKQRLPGTDPGTAEMYESARYLTITGAHWKGTPRALRSRTAALKAVHARVYGASSAPSATTGASVGCTGDLPSLVDKTDAIPSTPLADAHPLAADDVLLHSARHAANGDKFSRLFDKGDRHGLGYPSPSEADAALLAMLLYWTKGDEERADRLFRRSKLMRDKWERADYRQRTFDLVRVAPSTTGEHAGHQHPTTEDPDMPPAPTSLKTAQPQWTLYDAADDWPVDPIAFVVDTLIPQRGAIWVGGPPKQGKSLLMLYTCLAIACKRPTLANHFAIQQAPNILYIAREDSPGRLKKRRNDILSAWGAPVASNALKLVIRQAINLLDDNHVEWIKNRCLADNITLLVLDTWTTLSPSADPMSPKDQAQLAAAVVQLAQDIDGAVVVVDHTRKNRPEGHALSSADIYGPLQKWAAAEHILMLHQVGRRQIEVFVEGKDIDATRFFLTMSPEGSTSEKFTFAGSVKAVADTQSEVGELNRSAIYNIVAQAVVPMSAKDVTTQLAVSPTGVKPLEVGTVSKHLAGLVKEGKLRTFGQGKSTRYAVPNTSKEPSSGNVGSS